MNNRLIVAAVIEKGDSILLCRKPKDIGPYPNTWQIPGGGVHIDQESIIEAIKREVKEEAHLEIKSIEPIYFDEDITENKHKELTHYIFLTFRCQYKDGTLKPGDDIVEAKWVKKSEVLQLPMTKPSQKLFHIHPELLV